MSADEGLTYKQAGVDIEAGERLVDRIRPLAASTRTPLVLGGVGGFAGLCRLPTGMREPVLVAGTDGVGTKLKLAFALDRHRTVGIDLVAMCVNDVVTVGAAPLFFLDYFATGALDVEQAACVVEGIAEGCRQAGCALLGGETAELPGFYDVGEYDLAGFAVGIVDRPKLLDGSAVREGDIVLGLASSGLHSNGYSLARRALLEHAELDLAAPASGLDQPLGDALLTPTRIYVKAALAAVATGAVHALCHVTGGGLVGNLPRVLPAGHGVLVDRQWPEPPIFRLLREVARIREAELRRTFNLGVGFALVVAADAEGEVRRTLEATGEQVFRVGRIETSNAEGEARVRYAS